MPARPCIMPKILIVDDDASIATFCADILDHTGFYIEHAKDSRRATQCLAACDCDLMIADLEMPDTGGFGLILDVRKSYPSVPIIAVSPVSKYLRAAELMGARRTLPKPLSPDMLLEAVSSVLGMD